MAPAAALLLAIAATCGGDRGRAVHPLDGPDLDLRVAITAQRVIFHVVMNLAFVDELVDVPREDAWALHPLEEPAVRDALFAWYREHTTLRIDGVAVAPTAGGFAVDPGDPRFLPLFPTMGTKALIKVRFHLEARTLAPPAQVNFVWHAFPPNLLLGARDAAPPNEVQALLTAGGQEQVITLRHDEPEYTWHAPPEGTAVRLLPVPQPAPPPRTLALPLGSIVIALAFALAAPRLRRRGRLLPVGLGALVLAGASWPWRVAVGLGGTPLPDAASARAIFAPLHANIYRAFDYTEPSQVYDALAQSVQGELLDALYQDVYRSLVMHEEGGAVSRVQAVRPLETEVETIGVLADARTPSFTVRTRWQVDGSVFHWGHQHWRTNEHAARYTVIGTDQGWRIGGAEVIEQTRVDSGVGAGPDAKERTGK